MDKISNLDYLESLIQGLDYEIKNKVMNLFYKYENALQGIAYEESYYSCSKDYDGCDNMCRYTAKTALEFYKLEE